MKATTVGTWHTPTKIFFCVYVQECWPHLVNTITWKVEKCQKGTNNASYWLCSQWRMLSQEGILPWTRSVFCFGNVQASTGYQPWLLWWRSFSPSLVSFPSNPPVLLRICLSSFLFALTVFAPVSLALGFFFSLSLSQIIPVFLSLWYWDIYNDSTV